MLLSLLKHSFLRQKKAMAMMVVSVSMGTAIAASLIALSMDIKGKVSKELRSFGANITVTPKIEGIAGIAGQRRYLREEDIIRIKTIFWRHNIVGIAPALEENAELSYGDKRRKITAVGTWFKKELPLPGETAKFEAGVTTVSPWWAIEGSPPEAGGVVLGSSLSRELGVREGDEVLLDERPFKVTGIVETGGIEDGRAFLDLWDMQQLKGLPGKVSTISVSALTTPMDEFAYKDPSLMSRKEYEKWYCTGYVTSIAKQIEEVVAGGRAKPVWHIAETEGIVLGRMSMLIYLLSAASLLASALGVSTTMVAGLLRRLDEIGLMKAIGADGIQIIVIFLSEALIIGTAGGIAGYVVSIGVAKVVGLKVFGVALSERALLLPVSVAMALLIAAIGSLLPIRRALKIKPAVILKGAR
ncbi:MAG: ABC transporter permease [Thermodesulfovibrionales bacterium]|nr:ABC transporter permease [Thermodesulfovibrionales bacterium]